MNRLVDFFKSLFTGPQPTLGEIKDALEDSRRTRHVIQPPSRPVAESRLRPAIGGPSSRAKVRAPMESSSPSAFTVRELPEYRRLLAHVQDESSQVVLLLGGAGTGKSTAIRWLLQSIGGHAILLAPTGLAALNIRGQTIHSFCGFPHRYLQANDVKPPKQKVTPVLKHLKYLVIDEVSMVNANLLDHVAVFLERYGPEPGRKFGAVKLILAGDPLQLPPVVDDRTKPLFDADYGGSPFFFNARCLSNPNWRAVHLVDVLRQGESEFIRRLLDVRVGRNLDDAVRWFNANSCKQPVDSPAVTLVTSNRAADEFNTRRMNQLPPHERSYEAVIVGTWPKEDPAPRSLVLRVGAQVIFLRNDPRQRWVNGTLGTVERIEADCVHVSVRGETCMHAVDREEWEAVEYQFDAETQRIETIPIATFRQFPLKPAWAITIHKSQGQSYDACNIDFGSGTFVTGQAYVALSRSRSISTLHLCRPLRVIDVKVDRKVLDFCQLLAEIGDRDRESSTDDPGPPPSAGGAIAAPSGKIFISHATEDREVCLAVQNILEVAGYRCWLALRDMKATPDGFAAELARNIKDSTLMVVMLSDDSQASRWVQAEVCQAFTNHMPILPIWCHGAPGRLSDEMAMYLQKFQAISYGPEAVDELPRRVRELIGMTDERLRPCPSPSKQLRDPVDPKP